MNDTATRRPKPPLDFDEAPELSDEMLARARPASEVHGSKRAAKMLRPRGRPAKAEHERKQQVTLRLSPDVLEAIKAEGPGWQTRLDKFLRMAFLPESVPGLFAGPVVKRGGKLDLVATIEARVRAAGDKPLARGTTLFERMVNLSHDKQTGQFTATDPKKPKGRISRSGKKHA